jgi:hypothetical protein
MAALIVTVLAVHWWTARSRAADLLEHDEAISLLDAAGKSQRIDALYEGMKDLQILPAAQLQDLLRPTDDVRTLDVVRSLSQRDIHPPLYFIILHGLGTLGIQRPEFLRLFGTLMFILSAWIANRWIWPDASPVAKWLGTAWLLITPEMLNIATELRQYSLVYLGVMISIAALIAWWQQTTPVRHAVMLLALAPVVLLYTQFGTLVWVVFGLIAAVLHLAAGHPQRWKLLSCSVLGAIVLLLPLLLWGIQISRLRGETTLVPMNAFYDEAFQPLCRSLADSWCLLPWGWRGTALSPVIALLVLAAAGIVAWRQGRQVDRVLWLAASAWGGTWLLLLASGHIPPHAILSKQLAPLTLIPICLLVRASGAAATRTRHVAIGILAVSLVGLIVGTGQMLLSSRDLTLPTCLREADCLITDAPRRGYLLPLVEKMKPQSRILIATPETAVAHWTVLADLLPEGHLVVAAIGSPSEVRRRSDVEEFYDRLSRMYREMLPMRSGSIRTLTEFRHRVTIPSVEREG